MMYTLQCDDVTDLRCCFQLIGGFTNRKPSWIKLTEQKESQAMSAVLVQCLQFYRHLFYNGALTGKCFLGCKV